MGKKINTIENLIIMSNGFSVGYLSFCDNGATYIDNFIMYIIACISFFGYGYIRVKLESIKNNNEKENRYTGFYFADGSKIFENDRIGGSVVQFHNGEWWLMNDGKEDVLLSFAVNEKLV